MLVNLLRTSYMACIFLTFALLKRIISSAKSRCDILGSLFLKEKGVQAFSWILLWMSFDKIPYPWWKCREKVDLLVLCLLMGKKFVFCPLIVYVSVFGQGKVSVINSWGKWHNKKNINQRRKRGMELCPSQIPSVIWIWIRGKSEMNSGTENFSLWLNFCL